MELAGVLNSRLLWKWFQHNAKRRGVGLEINGNVLLRAPIRRIDFNNPSEAKTHGRIVKLTHDIQKIEQKIRTGMAGQEHVVQERKKDAADHRIDQLIYALYGLNDDEIEAVGAATSDV